MKNAKKSFPTKVEMIKEYRGELRRTTYWQGTNDARDGNKGSSESMNNN